jgi:S1-C subfamily serine protease
MGIFLKLFSLPLLISLFSTLWTVDPVSAQVRDVTSLTDTVVKVFVTSNEMDYYRPWQSQGIKASVGSGAIIKGNRILTNAHVVSDHTFIQVKKDADPKKYTAQVEAVGYDCDLALLKVEDFHFFDGITPVEFGGLPKLQDSVTVIGYPQGGDKISITEGVVSRVEVIAYAESSRNLLTVQIDAAINPGNSGGPVLQNGKLVGIAMQVLQAGQNIGYMIPVPIIEHFFKDLEDKTYNGFPALGIDFRNTENMFLREFYGIEKEAGGVLITRVLPFSPAAGYLEEGDVILEINDVPIGQDGTFPFRGSERLSLTHLVTMEQVDDNITLKLVRNHKVKNIDVKLEPFIGLVPERHYYEKPSYFIYGGIVFTVLSTDLVQSWGQRWWEKAPLDLANYLIGSGRLNNKEEKEIIVFLNVLPDDINVGYHDAMNDIVTKVNEKDINSFKDFVMQIKSSEHNEKYTIIETENKLRVILSNKNIQEVNKEILERNNIPYQFSQDVAQWLKERKGD